MSNPWYMNAVNAENIELFEVTDVEENNQCIAFSRIYSDGTAAPKQQVILKDVNYLAGVYETKNLAIDAADAEIDEVYAAVQAKGERLTQEKARIDALREPDLG